MSDVINDLLNSVATVVKNSVEIEKEREFVKAKRGIDYSISAMAMSDIPMQDIDSKEKYLGMSKKIADEMYNEVKDMHFSSQDPIAGNEIRNYIEHNVDSMMRHQITKYGKNAAKTTKSLIGAVANEYISKVASGSVSVGDAISSIHNMLDKSSDVMSSDEINKAKSVATSKIINSSVAVVNPYDQDSLSDISKVIKKYGLENDKVGTKVEKMLYGAKADNFQKDLTNIIESKAVNRISAFKDSKLRSANDLINKVRDFSVNELNEAANSATNPEVADILRRRASFVDRSMRSDSISFLESQEGIRQYAVDWSNKDDIADFAKNLNSTTLKMKSIGSVSTVLSKANKDSLKLYWNTIGTNDRADIVDNLLNNSEGLQASVLSSELAKQFPDMVAYMELSSIDPANADAYKKLIDNDGSVNIKPTMQKRDIAGIPIPFTEAGGYLVSNEDIKAIRFSYPEGVGNAIIKSLKNIGDDDAISRKVQSSISTTDMNVIPSIMKNGSWVDPSALIKNEIGKDRSAIYDILGEKARKFFIKVNGNLMPYDDYPVVGDDIVLRNSGSGTYRINMKAPDSRLISNEMSIVYEDGSPVIFKLNDVVDRLK